jgi:hypothetical protein
MSRTSLRASHPSPRTRQLPLPGARSAARKFAPVAVALLAALALGACGESHTRVTTGTYAGASGKNAPYLDVGPLVYEVQISRELNPYNVEDAAYLRGVPAAGRQLNPGEEWFGVFLQVYNNTSVPHPVAANITISDTEENTYYPVALASTNSFAYRPELLAAKAQIPAPNTIAANGPTQGALLLYKIKVISLDNRPLTIKITDPLASTQTASAELDV